MPAPTINTAKELAQPKHRPVLLADFTFGDGTKYRAATIPVTYGGHAYEARILEQEIERLATLSEQGVDRIPSATVRLADPDAYLWLNYERASGKGFKGASLLLTFALYDPISGEFSTDAFVPFVGICDKPGLDATVLSVPASSKFNLSRFKLPTVPIQLGICPWLNPVTTAQRATASAASSRFYFCGESRDLTTAPPCSKTFETCTQQARFGGLRFQNPISGSGKNYVSGKVEWRNPDTSAKFRAHVPLWLGGVCWLEAIVANQIADGNYTRGEVIVGMGDIDVERVIVNNTELSLSRSGDFRWHYINQGSRDGTPNTDVPYNGNGDGYPSMTAIQVLAPHTVISPDSLMSVRVLGRRKSLRVYRRIVSVTSGVVTFDGPNQDCAGNPPFSVTISGNSNPALNGTFELTSWAYGPPGTVTLSGTTASGTGGGLFYLAGGDVLTGWGGASSPWALMDALWWARYDYSELAALTFADVAKISNTDYTYTDQTGASATQPRHSTAIVLRDERSAADVVRGIRQNFGGLLTAGADGLLGLSIEGPLCEQQPSPVDGSNYNTAVSSTSRTGATVDGYLAYVFDESNSWDVVVEARPLSESPNRVQFPFVDPTRGHAVSTFSMVESDDVARTGQETPGGLQVEPEGIASLNHAVRVAKLGLAKIHRGNSAGDTRGTDWVRLSSSFRGCKLRTGQIIGVTNERLGYTRQQFRITEIKPDRNYETMTVKGHWHDDSWYLDSNGSAADPSFSSATELRRGVPAPWCPNYDGPTVTGSSTYDKPDSLFDATDRSFGIRQAYEIDGGGGVLAKATLAGAIPVSESSSLSAPLLARQGTTATSGGTIPGSASSSIGVRRLYVSVASIDTDGKRTGLSEPCIVDITALTNTNTATVAVKSWDSSTDGYAIYAGWSPQTMCEQATGSGTPSSVTLTALKTRSVGPVDPSARRLRVRIYDEVHAGCWAAAVTAVGTHTITCSDLIDGTDNWVNRDLSVIAHQADGTAGVWNFRATAYDKTTGVFTVSPDPTAVGVGDVLVIRAQGSIHGADYIGDAGFINKFATSGFTYEIGNMVRIIAGKGKGQIRRVSNQSAGTTLIVDPAWDTEPDSTSRWVVYKPEPVVPAKDVTLAPNSDSTAEFSFDVDLANRLDFVALAECTTVDADGKESPQSLAPIRDIYLYGQPPGVRLVTADTTVTRADRVLLVDTTGGPVDVQFPSGSDIDGLRTVVKLITKGSADTPPGSDCNVLPAVGEDIDGASSVVLNTQYQSITINGSAT